VRAVTGTALVTIRRAARVLGFSQSESVWDRLRNPVGRLAIAVTVRSIFRLAHGPGIVDRPYLRTGRVYHHGTATPGPLRMKTMPWLARWSPGAVTIAV
jgi:hypothetical protein